MTMSHTVYIPCADPERFARGGPLADEGREDPSTTKSEPLPTHQWNAI